jgi:hypothetical protein
MECQDRLGPRQMRAHGAEREKTQCQVTADVLVDDIRPKLEQQFDDSRGRFGVVDFVRFGLAVTGEIDDSAIVAKLQQALANADQVDLHAALRRRVRAQEEDSQMVMLARSSKPIQNQGTRTGGGLLKEDR